MQLIKKESLRLIILGFFIIFFLQTNSVSSQIQELINYKFNNDLPSVFDSIRAACADGSSSLRKSINFKPILVSPGDRAVLRSAMRNATRAHARLPRMASKSWHRRRRARPASCCIGLNARPTSCCTRVVPPAPGRIVPPALLVSDGDVQCGGRGACAWPGRCPAAHRVCGAPFRKHAAKFEPLTAECEG